MPFRRPVEPSTAVVMAVYDLAWGLACEDLRSVGRRVAAERAPDLTQVSQDDRQAAHLALLAVYSHVQAALEMNVHLAVRDARQAGASFGEIAEARGVSRQAARQEYNRFHAKVEVAFSGGPRDGQVTVQTSPRHEIRHMEYDYYNRRERREVVVYSAYTKKYGEPLVYEFTGFVDDRGRPALAEPPADSRTLPGPIAPPQGPADVPGPTKVSREAGVVRAARGPGAVRVRELAKELGLTSKQVLIELERLGEYVKTASSLLEQPVAERVRRSTAGAGAPSDAGRGRAPGAEASPRRQQGR